MKRAVFAGIAVLAIALAAGGCSDDGPTPDAAAPADMGTAASPLTSEGFAARDQAPSPDPASDRKEVVTGSLQMVADDPIDASAQAVDRVEQAGGRVDSRSDSPETDDSPASSSLTIRLPTDDLDDSLQRIQELGEVTSVSIDRSDVTLQAQDLDARIAALTATVDRFRQLITTAADTADLIAIETALSDRQGQLDSLTSQKTYLADQIDLATISVWFAQTEDGDDASSGGFWGAVVSGWNALLGALSGLVLFVGAALPWIAFVAIVAAVVVGVVRMLRGRRSAAERGTESAQTPPSNPS